VRWYAKHSSIFVHKGEPDFRKAIFHPRSGLSLLVGGETGGKELWKLKVDGFDGIEGGLVGTYRRASKTMAAAYDDPTAENFHEWRKQAYHGYHMRLLRELWKPVMRSLVKEADELIGLAGRRPQPRRP
jgi:hypothetical protein